MMTATHSVPPSKHGVKRSADDSIDGEQRLAKRFNLLNLDHNGKLWIPNPLQSTHLKSQEPPSHALSSDPDLMQIEDTKSRIFIHNLDEELGLDEDTPEEDRIVFLGDVEKHLVKIPKHILTAKSHSFEPQLAVANQLVLYTVPSSLTVPEEQDSVRKAIIEARARAREQREEARKREEEVPVVGLKQGPVAMIEDQEEEDVDAMDVD